MPDTPQNRASQAIRDLWQRNLPHVRARVAVLEAAALDARTAPLSGERRAEAEAIAHKLAGSLGMFGLHRGTEAARAFEEELQQPEPDALKLSELAANLRATLFPEG